VTWLDQDAVAVLLALAAGGAGGLLVPPMIARVPEPEPDRETQPLAREADATLGPPAEEPEPPKEPYASIAARPWLRPASVLAGALAGGATALALGMTWSLALVVPLLPVGIALAVVDARTRLLPTKLVLPATGAAIILGLGVAALQGDGQALLRAAIGLVVLRSVFWALWWIHSAGMGFGDVRLSALLGWVLGYLGWAELVVSFYVAFLSFVVPGLLMALVRWDRSLLKTRIPFGPFLLVGALTGIVAGPAILGSLGY
jgi:leader peptidase (prepilin peptidase)/N-methyltransferase